MVLVEAAFAPLETLYPKLPTRDAMLPPRQRVARRGHTPTVFPGGSVAWQPATGPSLEAAKLGRRADVSAIHDFGLVRRAISRQQPPPAAPLKLPPKLADSATERIAQLAGLETADVLESRVATPAARSGGRLSAARGMTRGSSTGALELPLKFRAFPTKPSNRSEVVQLEAVLPGGRPTARGPAAAPGDARITSGLHTLADSR